MQLTCAGFLIDVYRGEGRWIAEVRRDSLKPVVAVLYATTQAIARAGGEDFIQRIAKGTAAQAAFAETRELIHAREAALAEQGKKQRPTRVAGHNPMAIPAVPVEARGRLTAEGQRAANWLPSDKPVKRRKTRT